MPRCEPLHGGECPADEGSLKQVLSEVLDAAVAVTRADFGNIQVLDPASGDLRIVAHRGFPQWWLDFWDSVAKGHGACGTALERGERVVVEDVEESGIFAGTTALDVQRKAGVRAVQSTPMISRAGKPVGMFSTHFATPHRPDERELRLLDLLARQAADMVERVQVESAMQALQAEMEQLTKFQVACQTAAAIAHELNQPLAAVTAYSEAAVRLLHAGNPRPDTLEHAVENSARQAYRAGRIVRELLDFLRGGAIQTERIDLAETIREILGRVVAAPLRDGLFRLDLSSHLGPVRANRLQVEKVLANLIENRIEAMAEAGAGRRGITVRARIGADPGFVQITVTDSGTGIDAAALPRIFDPFFTTKPRGLGMGLAISRSIIEAHGGRLWVESAPGAGACFHFTLPFASP